MNWKKKYAAEKTAILDLPTSMQVGQAGLSALHGVGQVLKDTFMLPENAAESARHFVHEVSTGDIPNPPKGDYYGWGPQHFTKTEVGATSFYPVKRGLEKVINKGLDLKDRFNEAMHPEDRAKRVRESTFSYNSKNAVRSKFNYYEPAEPISSFSGPNINRECGRCGKSFGAGESSIKNRNFGTVCSDCKDVLTVKPEEE